MAMKGLQNAFKSKVDIIYERVLTTFINRYISR